MNRNRTHIEVACWCQRQIRWVPRGEFRAGLTLPCGNPNCKGIDRFRRAKAA